MSKHASSKKSRGPRSRQDDRTRSDGRSPGAESDRTKSDEHGEQSSKLPSPAAIRETVESVVIAFILAFLFRTFEAEAFVIPTGSMAPTLMGRHKDVEHCPVCGQQYQVSASDEVRPDGQPGRAVLWGMCPACRSPLDMPVASPRRPQKYPSYSGDRILVDKFLYQFVEPKRWDVAVFKYPGGAKTNYIKRLVGLPGDTMKVSHGDLYVKAPGDDDFVIARKDDPRKLLAMLQPVFDNDRTPAILKKGWPARWRPVASADDRGGAVWQSADDGREFSTAGRPDAESWLRYEHRAPTEGQWASLTEGHVPDVAPQLISDFCSYNTNGSPAPDPDSYGLHWVGDLALRCTLEVSSESGEAILELVEGGWRMQCRIDVATGVATLGISALPDFHPTAQTDIRGGTTHQVLFANVDDKLSLWVDGRPVAFDRPTTYSRPEHPRPTPADLEPVGIASRGAGLRVSHLEILRDIYYIADRVTMPRPLGLFGDGSITITDFKTLVDPDFPGLSREPDLVLREPRLWHVFDDANMKEVVFPQLGPDQFLAMGDNSAKSQDGRLWRAGPDGDEFYVSRELLTGKALFTYWPHSWDKITVAGVNVPFPFFPNFAEMGFVR